MKYALVGAALLALAACGQGQPAKEAATEAATAPTEATNLKDKAAALGSGELALLAVEQVKSAPGGPRSCDRIWNTEDMGEVPADALTGSPFAAHVGARAVSIYCGTVGGTMTPDGPGQWLVFMPGDSMNAAVEPCIAAPGAANACFKAIPRNPA